MAEKTNINTTRESAPEAIEEDIARTRRQMSGTVNEIQERLSPGHLKDEAREKIRESTVDRFKGAASRVREAARGTGSSLLSTARGTGNSVANTIRSNPVPFAMIGAGLAWFLLGRSTRTDAAALSRRASELKEKAGDIGEQAQAKFEEVSGQVKETGSQFAGRAKQSASRFGRTAQDRARAAGGWMQSAISDNPLGTALALFGVGALIGFVIPETRKERQMMGSASESLLTRAKESAQRAIQRAQHAAEKAVQTAEEEYRKTA